ncbi:MAG TPA: M1 family aminopeptidase [bacterium]|nr:M1 family aminopeptidase [bacterium]
MRYLFVFFTFLLSMSAAYGQYTEYPTARYYHEKEITPREHTINIERMKLDVQFDPPKGLVKGKVTHVFKPLRASLDQLYFDGVNLRVTDVTINGKTAQFVNSGQGITVFAKPALTWNDIRDSITFTYEANPRKGIYFVGWNDSTRRMRRQIWTQGEERDHRYWIPMYDDPNDKVIHETSITFDKTYRVIANGKLQKEKDNKDGTKSWTYAMSQPHAPYLLMLAIGQYEVKNLKSKSGVPIQLWYYPDQADRIEPTYRHTVTAMDFLEKEIGIPYPWGVFANIPVSDFVTGAMENTTAVLFGDFWYVDRRAFNDDNYVDTDFHEQACQWFGDMITMYDWKHLWLQESFATYYGKLGMYHVYGEDMYQWKRREEQNQAINASENNRLPITHTQAGTARFYPKGSAVIDMMNHVWGRDAVRRAVYHFLSHNRFKNVETYGLMRSFMDTLGVAPQWFFDQWIYRGGEPHYKISYLDLRRTSGRQTEIAVQQTHKTDELTGLFKMPIDFEVHYADGTKDSVREWIENTVTTVVVPNTHDKEIAFVLFDPGSWVTKSYEFEKHFDELAAQALQAPNMIDRYDALVMLRAYDLPSKRELLIRVYDKETFHALKAEVAEQLVNDEDEAGRAVIRRAITDAWPEVRKAVINNVGRIPQTMLSDFEKLLSDSSYNVVRVALARLINQYPVHADRYLDMTKDQYGLSNEIKMDWLEQKVNRGDKDALMQIVEYSSNAYEFGTRRNAMSALKRLNYLDDKVIGNLLDAALNANESLSNRAKNILDYFTDQSPYRRRIQSYYRSHTWEDWQKEILQALL